MIHREGGITHNYDLNESELGVLTASLRARYATFIEQHRRAGSAICCIAIDGNDPLADLGRCLEQRIFDDEAGDHSVETMQLDYGAYEDRSIFFLAYDIQTDQFAGSLRAITGTAGYGPMVKTMRDCLTVASYSDLGVPDADAEIDLRDRSLDIDPEVGLLGGHRNPTGHRLDRRFLESYHVMRPGDGIFDMATVVVPKDFRSSDASRISLLLYACSWRGARALRIPHAVTFIRQDLLESFRVHLGMDWQDLGGLGSTQYVAGDPFLSQPAYAHLEGFEHTFARERIKGELGAAQKADPPFGDFVQLMTDPASENLFLLG